jgi:transposase
VISRAATAFWLAASALRRSQSALGAKNRRLQGRLGAPKAITAMAHHLARLFYRMIKYGSKYVDHGAAAYEFKEQQLRWLSRKPLNSISAWHPFRIQPSSFWKVTGTNALIVG